MVQRQPQSVFAHLPSQVELCQRILTQVRFSSRFVCVLGEDGIGKSTVASALLDSSGFANQAWLKLQKDETDSRVRQVLLSQLLHEPLFNQDDSLADSFFRNAQQASSPLLLVLDNAQHLSPQLIVELAELQHRYLQQFKRELSVVLFSRPSLQLLAWLKQLSRPVLNFEISPLSMSEAMALANSLFTRADYRAGFENEQAVEQHIASANGNPKLIYQYVDDIVTGDIPMVETTQDPRKKLYIVLAVILCAAVAGLTVQVIKNWGEDQGAERAPVELPALLDDVPVLTEAETDLVEPQTVAENALEESQALLEPVTGQEIVLTQEPQDELRVVVEDEVVSKLLHDQEQPITPAEERVSIELDETSETPVDVVAAEVEIVADIKEAELTAVDVPVEIKLADVPTMLKQKPAENYTLQLMAISNRDKAEKFVSSKQWQHPVWVYRSAANPKVPFKIIYGDFTSREKALAARKQLQAQNLDSLVKQFKQVQFELNK